MSRCVGVLASQDYGATEVGIDAFCRGGKAFDTAGPVGLSGSHIQATVVYVSKVRPVTWRFVKQVGAKDRVQVMTATVVRASFTGSFDVAVLRAFVHVLPTGQLYRALRNINKVIDSGGVIDILGYILDDSRLSRLEEVSYGTGKCKHL